MKNISSQQLSKTGPQDLYPKHIPLTLSSNQSDMEDSVVVKVIIRPSIMCLLKSRIVKYVTIPSSTLVKDLYKTILEDLDLGDLDSNYSKVIEEYSEWGIGAYFPNVDAVVGSVKLPTKDEIEVELSIPIKNYKYMKKKGMEEVEIVSFIHDRSTNGNSTMSTTLSNTLRRRSTPRANKIRYRGVELVYLEKWYKELDKKSPSRSLLKEYAATLNKISKRSEEKKVTALKLSRWFKRKQKRVDEEKD
uniref:Homeobox domain-containing protein n=1 Tax=Strongyloides papillosus TaxID=174720 RepID=A0A0N5C5Y6_STREA